MNFVFFLDVSQEREREPTKKAIFLYLQDARLISESNTARHCTVLSHVLYLNEKIKEKKFALQRPNCAT